MTIFTCNLTGWDSSYVRNRLVLRKLLLSRLDRKPGSEKGNTVRRHVFHRSMASYGIVNIAKPKWGKQTKGRVNA